MDFYNLRIPICNQIVSIKGNEVMSNLPLQMAAYFNVVFSPVWVIVLLNFLIGNYSLFSRLVQLTIVIITSTIFAVEIIRLYMLYEGNLNDKIPELAGFWMLSVFLQLPLQGLLLFNPYFQLGILEIVCQAVILILLCVEIIFGYFSLRYTASQQANFYKLKKSKADYGNSRE
ncbi:transmembrane protein 17-like isoform X2 [Euwallacea fornicatus]|uniref:transmembrane protein 17-like isoform X2 n=1 Tax=Euwallacea fornicatus TaxID=995702 RepID=UPI00338FD2DD